MGDNYKLYTTLEIDKGASASDIKKAYHKMAMKWHPDKNKDKQDAEGKFKEISNAYNILSNEEEKQKYDMCGDKNYNRGGGNGGGGGSGGGHAHSDIFEAFFRGRGGGFGEDMFGFGHGGGSGGGQNRRQQKASSIEKVFTLTLEDIYDGVKKDLNITLKKYCIDCNTTCGDCDGKGMIHRIQSMGIMQTVFQTQCGRCDGEGVVIKGRNSCKLCNGKGVYTKEKKATLIIPKGVTESYRTAFPELGEQPKTENTKPGDLIIKINIEEHKNFQRVGNDLHYKTNLSFIGSIVGEKITIPYFKETIELNTRIFGVISNGKKYLIEDKGMPILNTTKKGNMYIEFNISYPKIKKEEKQEKLDELKKLLGEVFG
jgi:DnaJ-class molecular chaperone